jgi:hypothetical protein
LRYGCASTCVIETRDSEEEEKESASV